MPQAGIHEFSGAGSGMTGGVPSSPWQPRPGDHLLALPMPVGVTLAQNTAVYATAQAPTGTDHSGTPSVTGTTTAEDATAAVAAAASAWQRSGAQSLHGAAGGASWPTSLVVPGLGIGLPIAHMPAFATALHHHHQQQQAAAAAAASSSGGAAGSAPQPDSSVEWSDNGFVEKLLHTS